MRYATVYARKQMLYVHPSSQTVDGVWIGISPIEQLSQMCANEELGTAVLRALTRSAIGIPHPAPSEWSSITRPLLDVAGVKSWSAFSKGTRSVAVELGEDELNVVPTRNLGARDGFEALSGLAVRARVTSPAAVGEQVRTALQASG